MGDLPWRYMLIRLLAAAQVRTPGGPWLVDFDDFRKAAHVEPELLCLFSWCLPRTPCRSRAISSSSTNRLELDEDAWPVRLYRIVRVPCTWVEGFAWRAVRPLKRPIVLTLSCYLYAANILLGLLPASVACATLPRVERLHTFAVAQCKYAQRELPSWCE